MTTDLLPYSPLRAARYVMGEKEHSEHLAHTLSDAPEGTVEHDMAEAASSLADLCIDGSCSFYRVVDEVVVPVPMVDGLNACDALRALVVERQTLRSMADAA